MLEDSKTDYENYHTFGYYNKIENVNGEEVTTNKMNNDMKIYVVNSDVGLDKFSGKLECDIVNGTFSSGCGDSTKEWI